ncbi:carnitinyl-CoA dehydratase [Salmonella enterica subsp. arizonae]|nr:carnitinyl-CoA dehydratase [Salmonella enterica subsp. arizonae]
MSESLRLTRNGPILEITLDRPKANAIDARTSFAMARHFLASATTRICAWRSSPEREKNFFLPAGI